MVEWGLLSQITKRGLVFMFKNDLSRLPTFYLLFAYYLFSLSNFKFDTNLTLKTNSYIMMLFII